MTFLTRVLLKFFIRGNPYRPIIEKGPLDRGSDRPIIEKGPIDRLLKRVL